MSIGNAHVYDQDVYDRGVRIDRHDNICSSQEARGCDAGDSIISTLSGIFYLLYVTCHSKTGPMSQDIENELVGGV